MTHSVIGINASLIFIHATGFNTATHAFPTQQVPKVVRQSLLPDFDAVPWFPPADQRIAAQFVTRTVNEVVATTQQVRVGLDDLAAPIREERAGLENRLREERSRLEENQHEGRLSLELDLREKRSGLEKNLKARVAERQRLEETLRKGVHPAERKAVESRLAEAQQAENRLHDEIAEHEKRAQEMLEKLDAKEKRSLAELDSQEKLWKGRLEELVIKERHLKELEKEAAPILEALKQQLETSQKRLNESVQELDRSYAGVRGYSSDLLPIK